MTHAPLVRATKVEVSILFPFSILMTSLQTAPASSAATGAVKQGPTSSQAPAKSPAAASSSAHDYVNIDTFTGLPPLDISASGYENPKSLQLAGYVNLKFDGTPIAAGDDDETGGNSTYEDPLTLQVCHIKLRAVCRVLTSCLACRPTIKQRLCKYGLAAFLFYFCSQLDPQPASEELIRSPLSTH
jgi:hypothetical protein